MRSLVVDDEFVALSKLKTLLEAYGQVDTASDGPRALELFRQALEARNPYHLVTLDIEMPGMDGVNLLRKLVQEEHIRGAMLSRKIMVTAASSKANVWMSLLAKCDAFLVKPVRREVLEKHLAALGLVVPGQAPA